MSLSIIPRSNRFRTGMIDAFIDHSEMSCMASHGREVRPRTIGCFLSIIPRADGRVPVILGAYTAFPERRGGQAILPEFGTRLVGSRKHKSLDLSFSEHLRGFTLDRGARRMFKHQT